MTQNITVARKIINVDFCRKIFSPIFSSAVLKDVVLYPLPTVREVGYTIKGNGSDQL